MSSNVPGSNIHFPIPTTIVHPNMSSSVTTSTVTSSLNVPSTPPTVVNYGASSSSDLPTVASLNSTNANMKRPLERDPERESKRFRDSSAATTTNFPQSPKTFATTMSPFTPMNDKQNKGLRHFSMKVCQKVKEKGITTYNEVADELVQERQAADNGDDQYEDAPNEPHGPKNIRRRVYDALNVLMAMKIISKEKKEIRWIGLPNNSVQEFSHMEDLRAKKLDRIKRKTAHLQELILQQLAFKNLIKRNSANAKQDLESGNCVHLPFIIVNTSKETAVNCQIAEDKSELFFDFDKPFEIHDDIEVLKRMGLAFNIDTGKCTAAELEQARNLIPSALYPYLEAMVNITDKPPSQPLQ